MKTEMTDINVLKALGYKKVEALSASENKRFIWRHRAGWQHQTVPNLTENFDVLVAELRRHKILWMLSEYSTDGKIMANVAIGPIMGVGYSATTPAKAMCYAVFDAKGV